MKITVSCLPEEAKADNILELLRKRYPKARVHQKTANPPYIVTSFTVKAKKG